MSGSLSTYAVMTSPLGEILIMGNSAGLTAIAFQRGRNSVIPEPDWQVAGSDSDDTVVSEAIDQLRAYFAGELQEFDLPLAPVGTPFQKEVWQALLEIPYGQTISYGELADRLGKPNAARAVGAANGQNPVAIVIPCHRVIGSDGSLTGYASGVDIKAALLGLERNGQLAFNLELFPRV
jgi:methylated-DNA-[protein]-cysteine S-methyltransferase